MKGVRASLVPGGCALLGAIMEQQHVMRVR